MKRFFIFISVCLLGLCVFASCEKEEEKLHYSYEATINAANSEVDTIDDALAPRLDKVYKFTESEAQAEWNAFLSKIDESKLKFVDGEFYTVSFYQMDVSGSKMKPIKTIGTKTWK